MKNTMSHGLNRKRITQVANNNGGEGRRGAGANYHNGLNASS